MTDSSTISLEWEVRIARVTPGNTLWNLWLYPVFSDGLDEDAAFYTRLLLPQVDFDEFWWGATSGAENHFRTASWNGSSELDDAVEEILTHIDEEIARIGFDGWLDGRRQVNARRAARSKQRERDARA